MLPLKQVKWATLLYQSKPQGVSGTALLLSSPVPHPGFQVTVRPPGFLLHKLALPPGVSLTPRRAWQGLSGQHLSSLPFPLSTYLKNAHHTPQ